MEPIEISLGNSEFHSTATISLGELITDGWIDWDDDSWKWDYYDEDQYNRMCQKIEGRFWARDLGILPIANWKRRFISYMNEIMPKYKLMYDIVKDPNFNPLMTVDEYYKSRDIFSEFPQTSLGGKQDYASAGTDREYERSLEGDVLDKLSQLSSFRDIDVMILDDLEVLFSSLYTFNINYY